MIGANPQQLRDLGAFMKQRADLFDNIVWDLGQRLNSAGWHGPDAEQARARWDAELRPKVRSAVQALIEASKTLERHAREQEQASEGGGSSGGGGDGGVGTSGGGGGGRSTSAVPYGGGTGYAEVGKTYGGSKMVNQERKSSTWDPTTKRWVTTSTEVEDGAKNRPQKTTEMAKTWKDQLEPQVKYDIASGHAEATVGKVGASAQGEYGSAFAEAKGPYAEADARLSATDKGYEGSAAVELGLAKASAGAAGTLLGGALAAKAAGEVYVGGEARGKVAIGTDGLKASGEAFAGAKVSGEVGGSVAGVGGKAVGEAWAGVGVAGEIKAGFEDGKLTLGASGGVAVGIGAKLGFQVTIDVNQTMKTLNDGANAVGSFFGGLFGR